MLTWCEKVSEWILITASLAQMERPSPRIQTREQILKTHLTHLLASLSQVALQTLHPPLPMCILPFCWIIIERLVVWQMTQCHSRNQQVTPTLAQPLNLFTMPRKGVDRETERVERRKFLKEQEASEENSHGDNCFDQ